ncbi:MAG: hypothetical protein BGO25_03490 [Acidobacteriales bacterium 59-55]|nr:MAG: hypothetical protein BGO25_03490 [Acidobacteriales bacterium 59-55]
MPIDLLLAPSYCFLLLLEAQVECLPFALIPPHIEKLAARCMLGNVAILQICFKKPSIRETSFDQLREMVSIKPR